jgi:hypothetical protein
VDHDVTLGLAAEVVAAAAAGLVAGVVAMLAGAGWLELGRALLEVVGELDCAAQPTANRAAPKNMTVKTLINFLVFIDLPVSLVF